MEQGVCICKEGYYGNDCSVLVTGNGVVRGIIGILLILNLL